MLSRIPQLAERARSEQENEDDRIIYHLRRSPNADFSSADTGDIVTCQELGENANKAGSFGLKCLKKSFLSQYSRVIGS